MKILVFHEGQYRPVVDRKEIPLKPFGGHPLLEQLAAAQQEKVFRNSDGIRPCLVLEQHEQTVVIDALRQVAWQKEPPKPISKEHPAYGIRAFLDGCLVDMGLVSVLVPPESGGETAPLSEHRLAFTTK